MKILITGSNGLLGQKLVKQLMSEKEHSFLATARGENRLISISGFDYQTMDITNKKQVFEVVESYMPDCIIHTAAMTNVDQCESEKEACLAMNVEAVKYLAEVCDKHNIHLVHVSTDFIFDGTHGPLREDEKPNPISFYGQSKLDAELIVQKMTAPWSIARTVLVIGIVDQMSRSNIVLWAKGALEKGQKINVVTDQFRTPTLAEDLADGCLRIADKKAIGVFNISGPDQMSIFELVNQVAEHFNLDKTLINPVNSTNFSQPAKRPPITGFVIEKARKELNYNPRSFKNALSVIESQILAFS